jgi:PAS domain-containing protein
MECVILSYFDNVLGPRIFLIIPENTSTENLTHVTALMDLDDEGFSVYMTDQYRSANRIFTIPNENARGGSDTLQLSVVVDIDTNIDLNFVRKLLTDYSKRIIKIKDCYKAFHRVANNQGDELVYLELKRIFKRFYKSVKPIITILKEADKRLRESEKRYRELVENVNSIILQWDFKKRYWYFSSRIGHKWRKYENFNSSN